MPLITANNLNISFSVFGVKSRSLKSKIINQFTGGNLTSYDNDVYIHALKDINFSFYEGDRVGIYGHNGSGKSTLLRALAGVYSPTHGELIIKGSVTPLLDIFLGLNSDSTGYENIISRGLILGFSIDEIMNKIDEIINFSGIGQFIDLPLRTYSSGMQMRLAFSISTSFKSNILLVDEWMSTGDEDFQKISTKRFNTLIDNAKIFFIASHEKKLLKKLCNKFLILDKGEIKSTKLT